MLNKTKMNQLANHGLPMFFAFIFIRGYEDTFIYLGGQHGYYLSEVMMNNIGIPGTVLLLVGLFLIVAIFTSKRTIPFLQNVFSFGWLKNRLKRDKSETTEVPEEEEDVEGEAEVYAPVEKTAAAPQPVAYQETMEEVVEPDEYVFDTETEMRKAEVETEVSQKDDFEFEVARGDDPVVEAGNGNNTIFEVEVPEEEEEFDQSQLGKYDPRLDLSRYMFPTLDLLKFYDSGNVEVNREELEENQKAYDQTKVEYDRLEEELEKLTSQMDQLREDTQNKAIRRQQLDGEIKVLREQILAGVQNEEHYKNRLQTIEADLKERQTSLESQEQEKSQLHAALLQAKKRQGDEEERLSNIQAQIEECTQAVENGKNEIIELLNSRATTRGKAQRFDTMMEQIDIRNQPETASFEN